MPASSATDVNRTRAKARDKSVTRLAILEAGRKVVADKGAEKFTLADVAAEAGFARGTVYGYFRSKDELLQAVGADDLTAVARQMRGEPEPAAQGETASAQILALPSVAPAGAEVSDDAVDEVEYAETLEVVEALDAEQPVTPVASVEQSAETAPEVAPADPRADRHEHLRAILNKLSPNDPENSEGSAAAVSRLDRRLRVFEKTLADVQAAQERSEKSGSTSSDGLSETLRGLNQRLEESERRQRETFAELRASSREAAWRLEKLEGAAKSGARAFDAPLEAVAPASIPVEPQVFEAKVEEPAPAEDAKPDEQSAAVVTYLAAARQSARAAMETTEVRKPRPWIFRIPRKYLVLTCALMSVVTTLVMVLAIQRFAAIEARADDLPKTAAVVRTPKLAMATALDELSAMASSGNGKAQLLVGMEYLHGVDGVQKNPVEAAKWIVRAAGRGEAIAQYWAGYVYQSGIGVSADPDEAMRWYEAAADQGNVKAMYNLGVGYAAGWNGAKDEPEAARWFARAARMGYLDAQFNLAVLYERGQGVPPNLSDAYRWYAIAASSGDKDSKARLDAIASQMNPDDLQAAQRSAMAFSATPTVGAANVLPSVELQRT